MGMTALGAIDRTGSVMRKTFLVLSLALVAPIGCRPPAKPQPADNSAFNSPAPAGQEEKWTVPEPKEEPKPAEPPPPPEPTSPPPEAALGYTFGLNKQKTISACSQRGDWSKKGESYGCSKPLKEALFPGKPVLSFCDDKLCAVGVAVVVETPTYEAWNTRFEEMKKALVDLHGAPTVETTTVTDACKNDTFVKCMDDGTANTELTWKWKQGHRVSLTMGKKKSGEGPSAIRFVSIVESTP